MPSLMLVEQRDVGGRQQPRDVLALAEEPHGLAQAPLPDQVLDRPALGALADEDQPRAAGTRRRPVSRVRMAVA